MLVLLGEPAFFDRIFSPTGIDSLARGVLSCRCSCWVQLLGAAECGSRLTGSRRYGATMGIIRHGTEWRGSEPGDIDEYLLGHTSYSYPVSTIVHAQCADCAGIAFHLRLDDEEGCAERICGGCGNRWMTQSLAMRLRPAGTPRLKLDAKDTR